jgi:hypothetical protein
MRAIWVAIGLTASGCAVRATPYRFAGPMVSAVSLDDVAEHGRTRTYDDGIGPGDVRIVDLPGAPGRTDVPATASEDADGSWRIVAENLIGEGDDLRGVVISRLPAHHNEKKPKAGVAAIDLTTVSEADDLRALVGRRDGRTDVAFAIAAATRLRSAPPAGIAALTDGPALVVEAADALVAPADASPRVGDLLIFDRAEDDEPASRTAIVIAQDDRGVYEMIYLSHGVVRRGFVDPARPSTKRDADGKIVNTFLRDGDDYPPKGTKYLAGELLAHVLVWSRL